MRLRIPVVGQQSENRSVNVNAQTTINLHVQLESDAKAPSALHRTPGLLLVGTGGSGVSRTPRPILWNGAGYMVIGPRLVKITSAGVISNVGTLTTSTGNVSLSSNINHLMVVDGTKGWTWDGATFAEISDEDFADTATMCTFMDGYSIINKAGFGTFQISSLNDSTAWVGADVATAEANPDNITALIATHKELWLFGPQTTEIWYNSGNADFPFEPSRSGVIEWGIHAPFSLAKADDSLFWLSQNNEGGLIVLSARGFSPVAISTRDIDWEISQLATTTDAVGWTYQQAGHTFYVLTFPTSDRTFVYDLASSMWHRRKSSGIGRWRAMGSLFTGAKHYCGDYNTNNIYEVDLNTYHENGAVLEAVRRTQIIHKDRQRLRINRIELDIETGVGLVSGQGVDPQIMTRYSKDGGHTWSGEKWRSLGKMGDYDKRVFWNQCGVGRDWVFEFVVTDPVKVSTSGGYADIDVLSP